MLLQGLQTIQQRCYNGVDQQPAAGSSLLVGRAMQCHSVWQAARHESERTMTWTWTWRCAGGDACIDGVCAHPVNPPNRSLNAAAEVARLR